MKKTIARMTAMTMIMFAVVLMLFALTQEKSHAAFNDRTPDGAKVMPASRVMTLPENKLVKIDFGTTYDYTSYYYFKIKPSKTGFITFKNDYTHGDKVALCNSKKKLISRGDKKYDDFFSAGSSYAYQKVLYYGVKKGTTYYIRVQGGSGEYETYGMPYVGNIKWSCSKFKASKYGKTKKKAKVIKKKKTVKGLFVAGNKKAQWFKITNKQRKTKVYFKTPKTNGALKVKLYYQSYGRWYNTTAYAYRHNGSNTITCTISKAVKHTYYLKVTPDKKSSGNYTLKWK